MQTFCNNSNNVTDNDALISTEEIIDFTDDGSPISVEEINGENIVVGTLLYNVHSISHATN